MNHRVLQKLDLLAILGISIISFAAISIQLLTHELPCPLCLLQRVGLLAIALPYVINIFIKRTRSNYLIAIITSFLTMLPSCRQVFLHIAPNTGNYGDPLFGLHLYTWVFIIGLVSILFNAILMCVCDNNEEHKSPIKIAKIIVTLYILAISFNIVSTFLECGLTMCPSDPVHYEILEQL